MNPVGEFLVDSLELTLAHGDVVSRRDCLRAHLCSNRLKTATIFGHANLPRVFVIDLRRFIAVMLG